MLNQANHVHSIRNPVFLIFFSCARSREAPSLILSSFRLPLILQSENVLAFNHMSLFIAFKIFAGHYFSLTPKGKHSFGLSLCKCDNEEDSLLSAFCAVVWPRASFTLKVAARDPPARSRTSSFQVEREPGQTSPFVAIFRKAAAILALLAPSDISGWVLISQPHTTRAPTSDENKKKFERKVLEKCKRCGLFLLCLLEIDGFVTGKKEDPCGSGGIRMDKYYCYCKYPSDSSSSTYSSVSSSSFVSSSSQGILFDPLQRIRGDARTRTSSRFAIVSMRCVSGLLPLWAWSLAGVNMFASKQFDSLSCLVSGWKQRLWIWSLCRFVCL